MNKLLLSTLLIVFANCSFAQIKVGPEVGLNFGGMSRTVEDIDAGLLGSISVNTANKMGVGVKAGAIVDVPLTNNITFQPGVFFSTHKVTTTFDVSIIAAEQVMKVSYLRVPLNIQYKFGDATTGRFFVGVGPYFGYAITGTSIAELDNSGLGGLLGNLGGGSNALPVNVPGVDELGAEEDLAIGTNDSTDILKPFDFGFNVNLGYELPIGVFVRGQFGLGVLNTSPNDALTQRNWGGTISVGYLIGFNKTGKSEE